MRHRANKSSRPARGPRGRALPALLAALLLACGLAGFLATPALAVESHPFLSTIGPEGKGAPGAFHNLKSVAVDPATGDVYVLEGDRVNEPGLGTLYKFDDEGEPLDFSATGTNFIEEVGGSGFFADNQLAIAPPGSGGGTAGDIYVANGEVVKIYSSAGLELGQLNGHPSPSGVATDASGDVFVKGEGAHESFVYKYTPTTNPVTEGDESTFHSIAVESAYNLAVDSEERIYLAARSTTAQGNGIGEDLWKLQSLEAATTEVADQYSMAVAVEPGTNDVYVSHGREIVQFGEDASYTKEGSLIARFGMGQLAVRGGNYVQAPGLAVAGEGGDLYVSNKHSISPGNPVTLGRVDVFGPLTTLPDALAKPTTSIAKNTAVLHGTISVDGGPEATCEFQYTTKTAFEAGGFEGGFAGAETAPCSPAGPFTGSSTEAVSAAVSGLIPGTEYRYRLVGQNENGSLGSDENGSEPEGAPSFETVPAFKVQTGSFAGLTETSVTLEGSINPEGVEVDECVFEYGETTAYGSIAPCEAPSGTEIGNGNAPVAVHAAVAGLAPGTEYHFRLVGGSAEFEVPGADADFGTKGPPEILSQAFSGVGQTTATVSGSIDPHSVSTAYFVEYVTEAAFVKSGYATATKAPTGGVAIGSGFAGVAVSQALSGLTPGTEYHFRLYAENTVGQHGEGSDRVFTTYAVTPPPPPCPANEAFRVEWSAALPDCRAYEQASSPDKNGGSVGGLYPQMFVAENGSAVTFFSPAGTLPPADSGGTQNYATYLARREVAAGSWSSQRLLPPEERGVLGEYLGSTPDLRYAVVEAGSGTEAGLYVIDTEGGAMTQIVPPGKKPRQLGTFGFDGASADGSRIFFESPATIGVTPGDPAPAAGQDNLYMWERSTGEVSLVGVLPSGQAPGEGSFGGAYEWYEKERPSTGGALNKTVNAFEPLAVAGLHAISPSGQQIFFTSAGTGQLYLRRGLGGTNPTTVRISAPNAGVSPSGESPAAFLEATPDGSRAFFMSQGKLTANAASGMDLYRWDASAPAGQGLTDVAPGAEVRGLLGANSAGTSGYFVGRGKLSAKAEGGGENLYRFAEKSGGGFRITFIATLAAGTEQSPDRRNVSPVVAYSFPLGKTSRLSENGETLLFASSKSLTGYDNANLEGISCGAGLCPELYLYSAQTEKVICISCDPTGESPFGAATLQDQFFNAYFTPAMPPAISPSRNLSADGTKVFFQTPDPLVTSDENGKVSCPAFGGQPGAHNLIGPGRCQDVYEWEAVGSGSCKAAEANGGCLYLLSTGQSDQPSYFVGASKDGSSAFIATASQLVPADRDQAHDIYDVREGGGLASQYVRPPVPCSSAEACKGSTSALPPPTSPGTSSFQGRGNPKPKQCRKGYVWKNGKCVKKGKHHHKKNAKKHHHKSNRATGKKRSRGAK